MARAPFRVLVLSYKTIASGSLNYGIFLRTDIKKWQEISDGDEGIETPLEAAQRESFEKARINKFSHFIKLATGNSIPAIHFKDSYYLKNDVYVFPEHAFCVRIQDEDDIKISQERLDFRWVTASEETNLLFFDSIKTAMWELNQRLLKQGA